MVPVETFKYFPPGVAPVIFLKVIASSFVHISCPLYFKNVFSPFLLVIGMRFPSFSSPIPIAISRISFCPTFSAASRGKLSWSSPSVIRIMSRNSLVLSSKTSVITFRSASPIIVPPREILSVEILSSIILKKP